MTDFVWRLATSSDPVPAGSLVLDSGAALELALDPASFAEAMPPGRDDVLNALRSAPQPLSDLELAVYKLVSPRLGSGAFAAALAGIVPPRKFKIVAFRELDSELVRDGETSGFLRDVPTVPPVIGLRKGEREHDCLVLTWSGTWAAMRCYLRTDRVTFSVAGFTDRALHHPASVEALLPSSGDGREGALR